MNEEEKLIKKNERVSLVEDVTTDVAIIHTDTDPRNALLKALDNAAKVRGVGFLDYMAVAAYDDTKIALKLLDKLIPSLSSQEIKQKSEVKLSIDDIIRQNRVEVPDEVIVTDCDVCQKQNHYPSLSDKSPKATLPDNIDE